jgi:large subunit ribosomal protein L30
MTAFKKPGRTTRDRKPAAKKAAAEQRAAAAALKAASGNTSTRKVKRVKVEPTGATITTQVRSEIGNKPKNRATLRALGLRRIGHTNTLPDRPEIRGMIARVPHLIEIKEGK